MVRLRVAWPGRVGYGTAGTASFVIASQVFAWHGKAGTVTTAALYARCVELDDDKPDDVCPGCGQNIAGWQRSVFATHHYRGDLQPSYLQTVRRLNERRQVEARWPFTTAGAYGVCVWDADYLSARMFRRRAIAEGIT